MCQGWRKRWNVVAILRNNAKHTNNPKPVSEWIHEPRDTYAALKRLLSETKIRRIYVFDSNYRCDPYDELDIYDTKSLKILETTLRRLVL